MPQTVNSVSNQKIDLSPNGQFDEKTTKRVDKQHPAQDRKGSGQGCPFAPHRLLEHKPVGGRLGPLVALVGRILRSRARQPPIPEGLRPPFLEATPWFGPHHSSVHYPYDLLSEGASRCGPIFRFEMAGKVINVISGPEALRVARESESLGLDRRRIFEPFLRVTGVPIFSAEGEDHETLRRLVRFGYTRGTIAPFVSRMSERVRELIRAWPTDLQLQPHLAEAAIEAMLATVTPERLPIDLVELGKRGELGMMVTVRQRPQFVLKLPRMKRSKRKVISVLDPVIRRHREGLTRNDPMPWMIDAFIAANANDVKLDDAGIRGGVMYALIAAYIYLGRQVLFMLVEAIRDPQTLAALQREIDTAFSQGPLTAHVLRKMPTLNALFVETNRRYPLLPGMPYETTRTFGVGDYQVGPNELVVLTGVPSHFDGKFYSCPWSFDQRRVRPPRSEHRTKGAYAPWGFPPRSCLAVGLCELVASTIVATILHTFDVAIPSPSESIPLTVAPLVGPTHGQPARIRLRSGVRKVDPNALYEEKIQAEQWDDTIELPELAARRVEAGESIMTQGEAAEEFFIIVDGHVSVWQRSPSGDERKIQVLGPGQAFGEVGILKQAPRAATVRADETVELFAISRSVYLGLAADLDSDAEHLARVVKEAFISRALRKSLDGVREEDLPRFGEIPFERFDRGEWVVREGEISEFAYVIVSGGVEILGEHGGEPVLLTTLAVGDIFGEIGVLESRPRTASARTTEPTVLARIGREILESLVDNSDAAASGLRMMIARRLMRSIERRTT